MNQELFAALVEERSIFRQFSSSLHAGDYELFYSPESSQVPHWNLAYPSLPGMGNPSESTAKALAAKYASLNVNGHFASADPGFARQAAEESEYFRLDERPAPTATKAASVAEVDNHEDDLPRFCDTIQEVFALNNETRAYFEKKMRLLATRPDSRFYVVKKGSVVVGACSTFRTEGGGDFLFNVAVREEFQGQGLARAVIQYAAERSGRPLYIYSHNPIMREGILPAAGFRSLGVLYCVPLSPAPGGQP
jgi:GNAT superfamily N-acetyltransferase